MRIISGEARGRRLFTPKDNRIRPTADRVKEALFNILATRTDLRDIRVLDICAGTGNLGLEALSRGASEAVFIDNQRESAALVQKNTELLGYGDRARVITKEALAALKLLEAAAAPPFQLVFLDPPYRLGLLQQLMLHLASSTLLDRAATVVAEYAARESIPESFGDLHRIDERCYGDTCIGIYSFEY